MSLYAKWTRILSSFVIFSLLTSLSVWDHKASASTTATVFSDVPAGHWAEKHAQSWHCGIVKGITDCLNQTTTLHSRKLLH